MTTYKRMDVVMAEDHGLSEKWYLGLIDKDFNEGDLWVKATAKDSPNSWQFKIPGWSPERIRLATEADIANAPDFAQVWLQQKLLDHRDPMVRAKTRKGARSIRDAGINRISDLARFTDKELLALDGIGKGAVKEWREQAFQQMQQEAS
ncbi:hypothetical protein N9C85_01140 [Synechococcus sp. AH-224-I15]|nr:hypothetical protein [Synechococcus sp. AH-224-I15]